MAGRDDLLVVQAARIAAAPGAPLRNAPTI
jgi:hypothetical protein